MKLKRLLHKVRVRVCIREYNVSQKKCLLTEIIYLQDYPTKCMNRCGLRRNRIRIQIAGVTFIMANIGNVKAEVTGHDV